MCPSDDPGSLPTQPTTHDGDDILYDPNWPPYTSSIASEHLARLVDAHAHPIDDPYFEENFDATDEVRVGKVCCMSSNLENQGLTTRLVEAFPDRIVPCYGEEGLHPWWSHFVYTQQDSPPSKEDHYRSLLLPDSSNQRSKSSASSSSSSSAPASSTASTSNQTPTDSLEEELTTILPHLPTPIPLSTFISTLRSNLLSRPTTLLGEVGLDKAFKVPHYGGAIAPHSLRPIPPSSYKPIPTVSPPQDPTYNPPLQPPQPPKITYTNLKTSMGHQAEVLRAQVDLAVELGKPFSLHSVQAQDQTIKFLDECKKRYGEERWGGVRFDLHSFGGSGDTAKRIVKNHPKAFFSFSTTINARLPPRKLHTLISSVPANRLLVESDWNSSIGSDGKLWAILGVICKVREWDVGECVDRLERNWRLFVGDEVEEIKKKRKDRGRKKKEPFETYNGGGERAGSNGTGSNNGVSDL